MNINTNTNHNVNVNSNTICYNFDLLIKKYITNILFNQYNIPYFDKYSSQFSVKTIIYFLLCCCFNVN